MIPYSKLSLQGKSALFSGIFWSAAVILTSIFERELFAALWILLAFWWFLLASLGLALFFYCLILLKEERKAALPIILPLVMVVVFWRIWNVDGWGGQIRFTLQRRSYERSLTLIQTGKMPPSGTIDGISYRCDDKNPQLISFIEPGGILDNYTAIVYDPTDQVLKINAVKGDFSNFNDPKLRPVKKLFGGDMVWAESLGNHWYRCGFT